MFCLQGASRPDLAVGKEELISLIPCTAQERPRLGESCAALDKKHAENLLRVMDAGLPGVLRCVCGAMCSRAVFVCACTAIVSFLFLALLRQLLHRDWMRRFHHRHSTFYCRALVKTCVPCPLRLNYGCEETSSRLHELHHRTVPRCIDVSNSITKRKNGTSSVNAIYFFLAIVLQFRELGWNISGRLISIH